MADQTEFVIGVNINGRGPVDVMMQDPSPGPHMGEIVDVRQVTKEGEGGKTTLRFTVTDVEEGSPTRGITCQIVIGTDWSKDFNVQHLVNLLLGMGANPEKIKGTVELKPAMFKGRRAPFYVKAAPEEVDDQGRKQFANKNWITPGMYEAAKRAAVVAGVQAKVSSAPAGATATGAQASAPAASTPPVVPPPQANAGSTPAVGIGDLFG